jgi:hypothetical protein
MARFKEPRIDTNEEKILNAKIEKPEEAFFTTDEHR